MRNVVNYTMFSAEAKADTSKAIMCEDFRHVVFSLSSATNATFTIKFQGSISVDAPSFDAAQSVTNQWDYIEVTDLESGSTADGATGVAFTDDDVKLEEANIDGLRWVCATITAYTDGAITLEARLFDNA